MPVVMDMKLDGMDEMIKALRKAADVDIRNAVHKVGREATKDVQKEAKENCPVDLEAGQDAGKLKEAIRRSNSKKKLTYSVSVSRKKAPYGISVEYGHKTVDGKTVEAQPFLIPAGRKEEQAFGEELEKALTAVAKKVFE